MKSKVFSELTGIPVSTLRFYEKNGLIPEKYLTRDLHNYRIYTANAKRHVEDIRLLLDSGFSISELKLLLNNPHCLSSDSKRDRILKEKLAKINEKQKKLMLAKQVILDLLSGEKKVIKENENWNCP
ncbi:MerR family transcriptional regulator [Sporolactobacillus shoreicorticis]|uniref:MerR family transcriptional regulator n=1 Tax=Sporolactobacillus shoreicorticis TaxID=1923877 RepID=A0ABW5S1Q3_9BACL|nr:MerR family transcriptional regulator [Sporolactobacillus shoreicorticis]MCO7125316.1 MerR family transcriptional regulator [Sporolactobacillus shoreicorticis]